MRVIKIGPTLLVLLAVTVLGLSAALAQRGAGAAQTAAADRALAPPSAADLQVLKGAWDLHPHLDPDSAGPFSRGQAGRGTDVLDMANEAKALGMRGFVIKQHYSTSAETAYMVRKAVPGVEVFGAVTLNYAMGALNRKAVEYMSEVKGGWGRVVWLPTRDAEGQTKTIKGPVLSFIPITRNGDLVPELKEIIKLIATAKTRDSGGDLVLATGHLMGDEIFMVVKEAQGQGVKHIVITHPMRSYSGLTIPQLQQLAKMGAFIEFKAETSAKNVAEDADAIRKIGAEQSFVASDWGQGNRPFSPAKGMAVSMKMLRSHGITDREIDLLIKVNPARILGLPAAASSSAAGRP